MEYCEGGSLAAIMGKLGTLTEAQISVILKDMLIGLEYLHNQRIFHRDIKADNVLLTSDGFAKLGTFPTSFPSFLFPTLPPTSSLSLLSLPFGSFPSPLPFPSPYLFPYPFLILSSPFTLFHYLLLSSASPCLLLFLSLLLLYEKFSPQFFVRLFSFREDFYITYW